MKFEYKGSCKCGNSSFTLSFPKKLEFYSPRACDCDFCVQRKASYLSDPEGSLDIESKEELATDTQGSEQAKFLSCKGCGLLIAVICPFSTGLKGAVNATLINEHNQLQDQITVSPKLLTPSEKLERWKGMWLNVSINGQQSI